MKNKTPYTTTIGRLADVIAAIQVMATYSSYKVSYEDWAERISNNRQEGVKWQTVFEEHPEFFRPSSKGETKGLFSLVLRRQYPRRFYKRESRLLASAEHDAWTSEDKSVLLSRAPLEHQVTKSLIDIAISLHAKELEQKRDNRWWLPVVTALMALLGTLVGAFINYLINKK